MRLRSLFSPMVSAHSMIVRRDWLHVAAFYSERPFDWLIALEAQFSTGLTFVEPAVVFHRVHGGNQSNGSLAGSAPLRLSRWRLVQGFSQLLPRRTGFWLTAQFLGRSSRIDPELGKIFRELADDCFGAWFSSWRHLHDYSSPLREKMISSLLRFAGCEEDLACFLDFVGSVTRSSLHPRNLKVARNTILAKP